MFVIFNMALLKSFKINFKMIQEYSALEVTLNKENRLHLFCFLVIKNPTSDFNAEMKMNRICILMNLFTGFTIRLRKEL